MQYKFDARGWMGAASSPSILWCRCRNLWPRTNKRLGQPSSGNDYIDKDISWKIIFSSESNLVWTHALVFGVVAGISRHIVAWKSKVLFVVHYDCTWWTIQLVGEFAAQFCSQLLLWLARAFKMKWPFSPIVC